ncbi:hypothetical protein EDD17DRAFT_1085134 [Pisolithus thermaeus]|nr:hypothetical protein EDD17DRAFT_1085134 [Pisolithus thermaeus]
MYSYANADIPCLMREILWFHGRPDGHQIESCPEVFSLAPTQRQIKVGDYGVISNNNVGYFECRGNIFNETEASKMKVKRYTNASPLTNEVTSRFIPYGTLTSPLQDAGLVLYEPKLLSLLNTQRVLDLLKQLSPRMRDYSLVTSVVECSGCSLTNDFKTRIEKQTRWYPKMWQGHVRDTMTNLQTVTPLYTIATPWVWYQGEPNRRVTSEYRKIRELFNVIKSYPPAHHRKLREKAVEFFEVIFGVKHLESLVGNVAFFEHLPSFSSKHRGLNATLLDENVSGLPNDSLKPLEESRSEKLVMELVEAMRGVTNHRDSKWLLAVKRSASMVQKITETLALEFLVDIYRAFPTKAEALNSFAERRKLNYHIFDQ